MQTNQGLAKLRAGGVTSGPILSFDSADLAEQVARMGFDWVWLDWQHGQWTEHTINNAIARFLGQATVPIVRVKGHEPGTINRVLDMGAMGIVVPMVQDADQARAAVQATYYTPAGMRSGGGMRLGLIGDDGDYYAKANDEIMLVVMVETEEAIANVTSIMEVPGVDAVLIGPGDLMFDVKAHGHDEAHHESLVLQVAAAGKQTGAAAGYVCATREDSEQRLAEGFRFIQYASDTKLMQASFQQVRDDSRDW